MELRVVRLTDHFDEACRFYGELLGWPVTREWPAGDGQGRGRIFGYGEVARVELIEHDAPEPVQGVFVSFEHPDTAALRAVFARADYGVRSELEDKPWGHRSFSVVDPTGLELVCFQTI